MRRGLSVLAVAVLLAGCGGGAGTGANTTHPARSVGTSASAGSSTNLRHVNVGLGGHSLNFMPLVLAQREGLFKKYGLDVTFVQSQAATTDMQALAAGQFPISGCADYTTENAELQGLSVKMVATYIPYLPYQLVTRPDVASAAALKGQKVGMSKAGSPTDFALRLAVRQLGLTPDKQVAIVGVGTQTTALAAMKSGAIAGTLLSPPLSTEVLSRGYHVLWNGITRRIHDNAESVCTTNKVIKQDPQLITEYLKGLVAGEHFFLTQPAKTKQVMASYLQLDPTKQASVINQAYAEYSKHMVPRTPYVVKAGVVAALKNIAQSNPKAATASPSSFYDNQFVKQLATSGFISGLYK